MCFLSISESKYIKDGITLEELVQRFTMKGVHKLVQHDFVIIDHQNRVYLTERGKIAKEIGFTKFLDLEILENKALKSNYKLSYWKYNTLIIILITLIFLLVFFTFKDL